MITVDIDITRIDKECTGCGETKLFEEFSRSKLTRDGLNFQCKVCITKAKADWKERNKEEFLQKARDYSIRYRSEKPDSVKLSYKKWAQSNRPYLNNRDALRSAKKKQAVPSWAKLENIKEIYNQAFKQKISTNIEYEIDHIIPLVSDFVCGLHCEQNLRIVSRQENASKGNRTWPDMWDPE